MPKAAKLRPGRSARLPPAAIRVIGLRLGQHHREYIRTKLGQKLGKVASSLERVSVRVKDVNGPRGGVDQLCRIKAVLPGLPSVVVEQRATTLIRAVDGAIAAAERAVMSAVRRRRTKPLRPRSTQPRGRTRSV